MSLVVIYELPLLPPHWIYEGFLTRYWFWVCEKRKWDMELFKIHTERSVQEHCSWIENIDLEL